MYAERSAPSTGTSPVAEILGSFTIRNEHRADLLADHPFANTRDRVRVAHPPNDDGEERAIRHQARGGKLPR